MTSSEQANHPIPPLVASITVGRNGGALGIATAPGMRVEAASSVSDDQALIRDLQAIKAWGAHYLVTLLEEHELSALHISELPSQAIAMGFYWFWLPITEGMAPDDRFIMSWAIDFHRFVRDLGIGYRVVLHSKANLGRAGTAACLLLRGLQMTKDAEAAMAMMRSVCPDMVQTPKQQAFLRKWDRGPHKRRRIRGSK